MFYREVIRLGARGLWIIEDAHTEPDIIVYYAHGQ
jgi:hypothetical protein